MTDNGNNPEMKVVVPAVNRLRASGPILFLAILFVIGSFLAWYFTWFGRGLSDPDISQYLVDEKHPRHVQHALLQIQQRIERGDQTARQWYPQLLNLSGNPETEFRLTVAWLMGFDNKSEEFHQALLRLVKDPEPIVRRNAALALVRFNDPTGRSALVAILDPYELKAPIAGVVASTLKEGSQVARGTLLGRITQPDQMTLEVRSPLPGKVNKLVATSGSTVAAGDVLLTINSDEGSVWEAMRGLALVGNVSDLASVERYLQGGLPVSERVKEQAAQTAKAIKQRDK
jgi:multidrug efflux pump subunit AcrA (membrane-fusion protein)